jgi:predicted metalloprotease
VRRFILAGIVLLVTSVGVTAAGAQRQPILARMSDAPAADPNKPPPTRPCPDPPCFDPSSGRTPAAFLNWVGRDVTAFWRKRVEELPLPYRWVRGRQLVVAPRQKQRSKCYGAVTSTTPLSYCAKDAPPTVLLPLDKARTVVLRQKTWDGWRRKGDFALAYVVAHEWAHHLQKVLNLLQDRELRSMKIELQADCLAGVWSHSVWARNLLGPGDIKQALALARLVGDAPGSPKNDKNAHGSATEREMWFNRGYETGKASNCIVA